MTSTRTLIPRSSRAAPDATTAIPSGPVARSAELTRILDDLVDAIEVRESYEPEVCGWDTASTIRRLERELTRAWTAAPRPASPAPAAQWRS